MASASIPAQPGERIAGKYQIERVIGTGGVGVVVAARHLVLGQTVALKFLLPGAAHDKSDVRRFEREAQSAVQLKSEHVCRVYDFGELDDGSPFIVMEYLDGHDLAHTLRSSGPLSIIEAVGHILQVCEAVAEAHSLGMVHRDLKPSNFFLTYRRDGLPMVKVLDFGIAKYKIELEQQDVSLTQTRALLGSPVYMSPEQVRSARSVDHRSDIWSLGVCLFELLTDMVPFGGETVTGVAAAVSADPVPPIARHRPDVPESLAVIIERCLSKRPDDRYQSIIELAEALVPFGPSEATYSLYRISGVSGIRRSTGDTVLTDSANSRASAAVTAEHLTQVSSSQLLAPQVKSPFSKRRGIWIGAGLAACGSVGLALVILMRHTPAAPPQLSSVAVAISSVVAPAILPQPPSTHEAPPQDAPGKATGLSVSPVASVSVDPTPNMVAAARPVAKLPVNAGAIPHSATAAAANPRPDGAGKKTATKKSFAGGSFDDIIDTRH